MFHPEATYSLLTVGSIVLGTPPFLLLSLYFGPQDVLINLDVNFKDGLTSDEIESAVDQLEKDIHFLINYYIINSKSSKLRNGFTILSTMVDNLLI